MPSRNYQEPAFPRHWSRRLRSGVLYAISLAQATLNLPGRRRTAGHAQAAPEIPRREIIPQRQRYERNGERPDPQVGSGTFQLRRAGTSW